MDQITLNGRDIHNDNPAERMSYHGVMNATQNRYKGLNFGYPSCVPAWDTNIGINGLLVGGLFKPDGVPNVNADECTNNRMTGRLHFHAHTAPLDIKFNKDSTSAYIAFHGSWYVPPPSPLISLPLTCRTNQPEKGTATPPTATASCASTSRTASPCTTSPARQPRCPSWRTTTSAAAPRTASAPRG
jgi:hypothetical protein